MSKLCSEKDQDENRHHQKIYIPFFRAISLVFCFFFSPNFVYGLQVKLIQNQKGAHGLLAKLNEQILDTLNCTDVIVSHVNVRQLLPVNMDFYSLRLGRLRLVVDPYFKRTQHKYDRYFPLGPLANENNKAYRV